MVSVQYIFSFFFYFFFEKIPYFVADECVAREVMWICFGRKHGFVKKRPHVFTMTVQAMVTLKYASLTRSVF